MAKTLLSAVQLSALLEELGQDTVGGLRSCGNVSAK